MKQRATTVRRAGGRKSGPKKAVAKKGRKGNQGLRGRANAPANKGQSRASMANRTRAVSNRP